jgi:hypothetical protein
MIAGGNWWRANEIVIRHLTRPTATRYRCRDRAVSKYEDAAEIQLSSRPGPQPFQSGAPSHHPAGLQAETLGRISGVARPCRVERRLRAGVSPCASVNPVTLTTALADIQKPAAEDWGAAFESAVATISELGGAKVGDRTMVDALAPAADHFKAGLSKGVSGEEAWQQAVAAAHAGRDATARMQPRLGRASYLGERAAGIPDAGAAAVVCWMEAISPYIH